MLTIGYGDITAKSSQEQFLCIVWMLSGIGFYSYTFGNVAQMIQDYDKDNQEYQEQLMLLKTYAKSNNLGPRLVSRIKRHLKNQNIQKKFKESEKLLQMVPTDLKG